MPRKSGNRDKFQYAEPQVFKYQTFDRDTRENLTYHQNPIFPDQRILFSARFTNARPKPEAPVAQHEPDSETAPLERSTTDEGYVSSNDPPSPSPSKAALAPGVPAVAEEEDDDTRSITSSMLQSPKPLDRRLRGSLDVKSILDLTEVGEIDMNDELQSVNEKTEPVPEDSAGEGAAVEEAAVEEAAVEEAAVEEAEAKAKESTPKPSRKATPVASRAASPSPSVARSLSPSNRKGSPAGSRAASPAPSIARSLVASAKASRAPSPALSLTKSTHDEDNAEKEAVGPAPDSTEEHAQVPPEAHEPPTTDENGGETQEPSSETAEVKEITETTDDVAISADHPVQDNGLVAAEPSATNGHVKPEAPDAEEVSNEMEAGNTPVPVEEDKAEDATPAEEQTARSPEGDTAASEPVDDEAVVSVEEHDNGNAETGPNAEATAHPDEDKVLPAETDEPIAVTEVGEEKQAEDSCLADTEGEKVEIEDKQVVGVEDPPAQENAEENDETHEPSLVKDTKDAIEEDEPASSELLVAGDAPVEAGANGTKDEAVVGDNVPGETADGAQAEDEVSPEAPSQVAITEIEPAETEAAGPEPAEAEDMDNKEPEIGDAANEVKENLTETREEGTPEDAASGEAAEAAPEEGETETKDEAKTVEEQAEPATEAQTEEEAHAPVEGTSDVPEPVPESGGVVDAEPQPETAGVSDEAAKELEPAAAEEPQDPADKHSGTIIAAVAAGAAAAVAAHESRHRRKKEKREGHWEREPASPTTATLKDSKHVLERGKDEYKPFSSAFARQIEKAKEERDRRHETEEYKEKQRKRRERREAREAAEAEERRKEREEVGNEQVIRDAYEAGKVKKTEELVREAEEKRRKEFERRQKEEEDRRMHRMTSHRGTHHRTNSSRRSSAGSDRDRPALLKRMTTGESDTGGPLLKINMAKAGGYEPRGAKTSPPASLKSPILTRANTEYDSASGTDGDGHRRHRHRRRHHSRHGTQEESIETLSHTASDGKVVTSEKLIRRVTSNSMQDDLPPGRKLWNKVITAIQQ